MNPKTMKRAAQRQLAEALQGAQALSLDTSTPAQLCHKYAAVIPARKRSAWTRLLQADTLA